MAILLTAAFVITAAGQAKNCDDLQQSTDKRIAQMNEPFPRQDYSRIVFRSVKELLDTCPNVANTPAYKAQMSEAGERFADHSLLIADYYAERSFKGNGGFKGAEARLKELINEVPTYSRMDSVLFLLGRLYLRARQLDDAAQCFSTLVAKYPSSSLSVLAYKNLDRVSRVRVQ